ncbi:cysteine peptidase family C39 domain-containing protein [uncultured Meiothermus sp.]|uniref:C39 family peptidase n=1 Tax=uncultured Meiothermus sp. TaxID=157471 RepID=UPI002638C9E8|nr:cysteine peptidase family C39 domain-containing protein [uncultured Meiothermus sp.]
MCILSFALASDPISHRDLRYQEVVGQTDWFTCGPAAAATLLRYHYDKDTSEAQMLMLSLGFMQKPEDEARLSGITALALRQAMQAKGLLSRGFRLTPAQLVDYFQRGGLPVLLHVTRPEPHYVVAVGLIGGQLVLADPSWGRRIMPLAAFDREKGFSGVALVPTPGEALIATARTNQARVLSWALGRLNQLSRLRNQLP